MSADGPTTDGRPWDAPGTNGAVLCLHGFSGTPFEVTPLGRHLADQGYAVSVPLLAGHGNTVESLNRSHWQDWLDSAIAALQAVRKQSGHARVGVVGSSMGGLLALRLAQLFPDEIHAVVAMATPVRLPFAQGPLLRLICAIPPRLRPARLRALPKRGGCDVTDPEMRRRNPSLPSLPLDGVLQMSRLAATVRRDLPRVTQPCLLVHGLIDHTVSPHRTRELARMLRHAPVETLWLPASGHLVGLDVERNTLFPAVQSFLSRLRGGAALQSG